MTRNLKKFNYDFPVKSGLYIIKLNNVDHKSMMHGVQFMHSKKTVYKFRIWTDVICPNEYLVTHDCYVVYMFYHKFIKMFEISDYIYNISKHKFFQSFNTKEKFIENIRFKERHSRILK